MSDATDDDWAGVEAALARFGLPAKAADRPAIVAELERQIRLEEDEAGDQFVMRLLCAQLFSLGVVEDSLLIWRAKACNFDTHCGIDVQLLCGAGLEATKAYLAGVGTEDAAAALAYLRKCADGADFVGFDPVSALAQHRRFYGVTS